MTTQVVGKAWEAFWLEKQHVVFMSFRNVGLGITLRLDGSEDSQLSIKDFPDDTIAGGIGLADCSPLSNIELSDYLRDQQLEIPEESESENLHFVGNNLNQWPPSRPDPITGSPLAPGPLANNGFI